MNENTIPRRHFWSALMIALGNGAARKLPWLMAAMAVLQLAFGAVLIWIFVLFRKEAGGTDEPGMILLALGAMLALASVILAMLFLPWIYRCYAWLHERGGALPWSPLHAAGCWLIPILNLYRPYQVMAELWRAVQLPGSDGAVRPKHIGVWWGLLLLSLALTWMAPLLEILGLDFADVSFYAPIVIGTFLSAAALALGSVIVRQLETGLQRTQGGALGPFPSGFAAFLPPRRTVLRVGGSIVVLVALLTGALLWWRDRQAAQDLQALHERMKTAEAECHTLVAAGNWETAYKTCVNHDTMILFKDGDMIPVIDARRKFVGQSGPTFRDCARCPEMIAVAPGRFRMGDLDGSGSSTERPVRSVNIAYPLAVGIYEVIQAEWDACVTDGGCQRLPEDEDWKVEHAFTEMGDSWRQWRPVTKASWDDATAYVGWLSRKTGQPYRLLSEAEWEYVARAGTTTKYAWGDAPSHEHAHYGVGYWDGDASVRVRLKPSAPVGMFPPNRFGVHDLLGNVWEWVEDCGERGTAVAPDDGRAWTRAGRCSTHVLRGGAWNSGFKEIRSASRMEFMTDFQMHGFRVAKAMKSGTDR